MSPTQLVGLRGTFIPAGYPCIMCTLLSYYITLMPTPWNHIITYTTQQETNYQLTLKQKRAMTKKGLPCVLCLVLRVKLVGGWVIHRMPILLVIDCGETCAQRASKQADYWQASTYRQDGCCHTKLVPYNVLLLYTANPHYRVIVPSIHQIHIQSDNVGMVA